MARGFGVGGPGEAGVDRGAEGGRLIVFGPYLARLLEQPRRLLQLPLLPLGAGVEVVRLEERRIEPDRGLVFLGGLGEGFLERERDAARGVRLVEGVSLLGPL